MSKINKIFTKKNAKNSLILMIALGIIFTLAHILNSILKNTENARITHAYFISSLLFLLSILIALGFQFARWIQKVYSHVTKYSGAKCFEKIDSYLRNLGECNSYYASILCELNAIYKTDPELEQLIKEKDLETLYGRKAYLENNLDYINNMVGVFAAFGISLAAVLAQSGVTNNGGFSFGCSILSGVILFLCVTLKYVVKGSEGSYIYSLHEYELELLNSKILSVNKQLHATSDNEMTLQFYHAIINMLVSLYSDRHTLKNLKLRKKDVVGLYKEFCNTDQLQKLEKPDIIWGKIEQCSSIIYFPLKIEREKYQYLNETHKKIYEILQKIKIKTS